MPEYATDADVRTVAASRREAALFGLVAVGSLGRANDMDKTRPAMRHRVRSSELPKLDRDPTTRWR
jgi:hypothetical protein